MKKVVLTLSVFLSLFLLPRFVFAHNTVSAEREILPVATCPQSEYEGVECVRYVVAKGDTLFRIAQRYSTVERSLTVKFLLELNPDLKNRPIPENLQGYSGSPWNRTSYDWIFPGDRVTLPLVFKDDVMRVGLSDLVEVERQQVVKVLEKNTIIEGQRNFLALLLVLVGGMAVIFFILFWRERGLRLKKEKEEDVEER